MPASSPLAILLFFVVGLVLAAFTSRVAAGDTFSGGGGRMVIIRAADRTAGGSGARDDSRVTTSAMWQRRRLEDEVAPEFPLGGGLLRVGIDASALIKNSQVCLKKEGCAGKCYGCPYTRPCAYKDHCIG
ncbi:hypothetical protein QOZ80_5AG0394770 [Eleusine coracana subsp. coracana]|nr:hypothetical protein QOZ80_5AG0394770 [Eleusine coracana subsp. coracana]